jgi:hypothetical protein
MKKVASLRYGIIFKKAFCDVDVFTEFVRDILGIHIEIDRVQTEGVSNLNLSCLLKIKKIALS